MVHSIGNILSRLASGNARTALIRKNIIASFAIKGWSVIVQLLLVPLTLACLGNYKNGVWLTISSVLLWIDNLDIGLGNGLRNKLAIYIAKNDIGKAREMVSSTLFMLVMIIVPTAAILLIAEWQLDNYTIFHVKPTQVDNLDTVIMVITMFVCTTFIFKFLGNFYMGLQLPAVNNMLITCGNTLALVGTFVIYLNNCHSLFLIALVNVAATLVIYLICYPITFCLKYKMLRPSWKYVKLPAVRELFSTGVRFFVLQIAGVMLFFSSNIIISQLFSPSMVTPYQIAHRYFMVATLLFTIICVPYWTATTDAYERKDWEWIKHSNRTLNKFMFFIFALIAVMIGVSGFVYDIWIGTKSIVPLSMTIIVGIYQFILICSTRYSFVLNGIGALRLQLILTIIAAVLYMPIAIYIGKATGDIDCLLIVMCVINVPGLIVNAIQYNKLINGKATGIWRK